MSYKDDASLYPQISFYTVYCWRCTGWMVRSSGLVHDFVCKNGCGFAMSQQQYDQELAKEVPAGHPWLRKYNANKEPPSTVQG